MANRSEMEKTLKASTLPRLREAGFKGTFPHLRRLTNEGADLASFQFDRHGGSFVIEIARCPTEGIASPVRGQISPADARAQDRHPSNRRRIAEGAGQWFDFAAVQPGEIANTVAEILLNDATWASVPRDGSETPYAHVRPIMG